MKNIRYLRSMRKTLAPALLFLLLMLYSCHPRQQQEKGEAAPVLWEQAPAITIHGDTLFVMPLRGDTSLSVTLYLPPSYSEDTLWPLILFFDPHGSGRLPVERYRPLAAAYGYILAGSNDIRNGMDGTTIERILRLLDDALFSRLSLDPKRFYTAGFSGGARVATLKALTDPAVRGAAACGGGLPATDNLPPVRFNLLGFAGEEDFNLPELLQLDASLTAQPCRHFLVRFDGTHEWPPAPVFRDAFRWFELNAMRDTLIPRNDTLIRHTLTSCLQPLHSTSSPLEEEYLLSKTVTFLDGVTDISSYRQRLETLRSSTAFRKAREEFASLLLEERGLEQYYLKNFPKPLAWWKKELDSLNRRVATTRGERHHSLLRVKHYLSLAAFLQTEAALKKHLDQATKHYLALYALIDPDNPDVWFFKAVASVRQGDTTHARQAFAKARELGFDDPARLRQWPELSQFSTVQVP